MRLIALLLIAAALVVPAFAAGIGEPGYFANVPLTTHEGKAVRFYDDLLKGKSVVINVIYTSCTYSCPIETAKMAELQRLLGDRVGKDIFFYSISIDPETDTPERLKAYATQFKAKPGWLFLTGKEEDIRLISKQLGLSSLGDTATADGHMPSLMIGNEPTNQWMRNSAVDNPRFLATTIVNFFDGYNAKPLPTYASQKPLAPVDTGEYLFQSRCALCHTIGKGDRIGPDLLNVHERRDRSWLARYITAPERLYAAGDAIAKALFAKYPTVRMPNLNLNAEEVGLILPYIEQQSRAATAANAAADEAKRWIALGNQYFDRHQRDKAIEAYAKALELDPDNPDVLTDQGVMYSESNQYEQAIANFRKAHALDPRHLPSLLNLGMLYAQYLKDHDQAVETWKRVIEIAPATAHAAKAQAYIERVRAPAKAR